MNFYGHAVVAARHDDDPDFVLGSMLPDLLAMVGLDEGWLREPRGLAPRLHAGIEHHHRVDACFHDSAPFRTLLLDETRRLRASGVTRGAATAAAHVAIELLLDGILAVEAAGREAYRGALARAAEPDAILWTDDAALEPWAMLVRRMRDGTVPDGYRDLGFVSRRVAGVLSRRPRLALSGEEPLLLALALPAMRAAVAGADRDLLEAVQAPRAATQ